MEWNIKEIETIVQFINNKLNSGITMKEIETIDFGVNTRVIHKRLIRQGYKRVGNEYLKEESNVLQDVSQDVLQDVLQKKSNKKEVETIELIEVLSDGCNTENHDKIQIQKNLLDLAKEYEVIKNMINSFKENNKLLSDSKNLIIELPYEPEGKDFGTSIRINKVIWDEFNEIVKQYKNQFTKKELLSQALKEFIQKYK